MRPNQLEYLKTETSVSKKTIKPLAYVAQPTVNTVALPGIQQAVGTLLTGPKMHAFADAVGELVARPPPLRPPAH